MDNGTLTRKAELQPDLFLIGKLWGYYLLRMELAMMRILPINRLICAFVVGVSAAVFAVSGVAKEHSSVNIRDFEELRDDLQELRDSFISQQVESFTFTNGETETAYDLRIRFNVRDVKIKDTGPFDKGTMNKEYAKFKNGMIPNGSNAKVQFEKDDSFNIHSWWWTKANGRRLGKKKFGPPPRPPN